jgi:MEMO1 family protein
MIIRKPAVAGLFYPDDPNKLKNEIENYLQFSNNANNFEKVYGVVVPHAGYLYSGKTAGYAYNLLRDKKYKTVVIISPSHREYFPGISVYDGDAYETPLGVVEIDKEAREELIKDSKTISAGAQGHKQEHAAEVQIPFLQTVLSDFKIVPIIMGDQNKIFVDSLAEKISKILNDDTLVVASSDLSHYHTKQEAFRMDSQVEMRINTFDYKGLQEDLGRNYCEACGGGGILSLMKALSVKTEIKSFTLDRSDSSDVTGDENEVVGYLSAAFYD